MKAREEKRQIEIERNKSTRIINFLFFFILRCVSRRTQIKFSSQSSKTKHLGSHIPAATVYPLQKIKTKKKSQESKHSKPPSTLGDIFRSGCCITFKCSFLPPTQVYTQISTHTHTLLIRQTSNKLSNVTIHLNHVQMAGRSPDSDLTGDVSETRNKLDSRM